MMKASRKSGCPAAPRQGPYRDGHCWGKHFRGRRRGGQNRGRCGLGTSGRGFRRVLPGGGTSELAVSYELERIREAQKGMEAFGMEAVSAALRKPMSQILLNAGYNPLEKMEEVRAADSDCMGIDCDSGRVVDYEELGVLDPAPVKLHGLRAAKPCRGFITSSR